MLLVLLLIFYLLERNVIDPGLQINHRWFKSKKVLEKLPAFEGREKIIAKMIELELLCEDLTYGAPKAEQYIKKALELFIELEKEIQ